MGFSKWSVLDREFTNPENGEVEKVFDPHKAQLQMMEDPARFIVAACGRRLGKSKMVAHELLPEAKLTKDLASSLKADGKRREFWSVGPQYSDSEKPFRVFWNLCRKLEIPMDKPGSYFSPGTGAMTVSLWDGAFIYSAKSAQHPDTLVGEALSGVHMEEAAKLKEEVWTQYIMPALSDFKGWAKFTSTPEGKNWFYKLFMDCRRKENWSGHRIPSWYNTGYKGAVYPDPTVDAHVKQMLYMMQENPEYTAHEIARMQGLTIDSEIIIQADALTIPKFQQEIAADFTDFVGKVFKEYDEETHSRLLPYNPSWETVAAVDYGYRNPSVWLLIQIGPWGEINVIDELYQDHLAPDEFAQEVLRRGLLPDSCSEFFPDPALPGDTRTLENIFLRAGKRITARPHTGGDLQDRLNLIRLALKDRVNDTEINKPLWKSHPPVADKRRPRLMISTKCPHTLFEFGEYRYPEKKDEQQETSVKRFELPMKKDDHTPEALGRFLASRFHSASEQYGGGTKISKANFLSTLGNTRYRGSDGYGGQPAGISTRHTSQKRANWIR